MKVWLLDSPKFISINGIQPVTNPMMFEKGGIPTSDGLFSTEIFGISVQERKTTFAYIPLGKKFINPKVYLTLLRLNRNFQSIIYGTQKFKIEKGVLVKDDNGETGIDFLYKNWDSIKFEKNDSSIRNERVDLITSHTRDTIFTDSLIVIPAFYRDINMNSLSDSPKVNEINDLYAAVLRNVKMLQESNNYDFMLHSACGKVQDLIVDIYNLLKDKLQGKEGYLKKFLMGKSVDYCARVVITAVPYNAKSIDDQQISFRYTGVPLAQCCAMFTPFIIWWMKRFFKTRFENNKDAFPVYLANGEVKYIKLDSPETYYNEEYISHKLEEFLRNPSGRFDTIEIPVKEEELKKVGKTELIATFKGYRTTTSTMDKTNEIETRPLTWMDLFYMAAVDVTEDKHIIITRYPLLDYLGTFFSKISVLSTLETKPMIINDKLYKHYPVIDLSLPKDRIEILFRDTVAMSPLYLAALGGDHDGDQITAKGVFTQEANENAEQVMNSKLNLLTIYGNSSRKIGNEGVQTIYTLTRFKN